MMLWMFSFFFGLFCFMQADAQNSFSLEFRESDPASFVDNVSVIHGDYTEVEVDLTVSAPDSLVLSRFYSSRDTYFSESFGGWRFNPHLFLIKKKFSVDVGHSDGSILTYQFLRHDRNYDLFTIDVEEEMLGVVNTAKGDISGWTNLRNNELYFYSQTDSFELHLASEGRRFYIKHPFLDMYCMTHEILPSGNKIFYEFEDCQTAAMYMGCIDLDMTFHEREEMIYAVEQSQTHQMDVLGDRVKSIMSIDESDAVYQSFRSVTTMGLEVGSLLAGGYGAAKGVIGFSKLAKMSKQIAKVAKVSTESLKGGNGFLGHKGFELKNASYQPVRNKPTNIQGRFYSGHALDQMQNRGFIPSGVEETIQRGSHSIGKNPGTKAYYNMANDMTVILNTEGRVITISYGDINQ